MTSLHAGTGGPEVSPPGRSGATRQDATQVATPGVIVAVPMLRWFRASGFRAEEWSGGVHVERWYGARWAVRYVRRVSGPQGGPLPGPVAGRSTGID